MKVRQIFLLAGVVSLTAGCATPLNQAQRSELKAYQAKGLAVEEKDPGTAAVLGILPGCGSFYTRNIGIGVANLLLWPISVAWDPVSGYDGAESINYYATKVNISKQMGKEMKDIEEQMEDGKITKEEYLKKKRECDKKYSPEF